MPTRTETFVEGNYYHIYNRGAGKSPIFFTTDNYEYCLRLLKRYRERYEVSVIAYCLMPNHYHFLLRQDSQIPLSNFINVVFNAYVQAVNRQQKRSGTLFQGRFRHVLIDREEYLMHLCRYIHLNPVKASLVVRSEEWPYSNYLEWIGQRNGSLIDQELIKTYFPNHQSYYEFVNDYQENIHKKSCIEKFMLD